MQLLFKPDGSFMQRVMQWRQEPASICLLDLFSQQIPSKKSPCGVARRTPQESPDPSGGGAGPPQESPPPLGGGAGPPQESPPPLGGGRVTSLPPSPPGSDLHPLTLRREKASATLRHECCKKASVSHRWPQMCHVVFPASIARLGGVHVHIDTCTRGDISIK